MKKILSLIIIIIIIFSNTTYAQFNDIEGHWGTEEITQANKRQLINGYLDGTFRPNEKVTFGMVYTLIDRVLNQNNKYQKNITNNEGIVIICCNRLIENNEKTIAYLESKLYYGNNTTTIKQIANKTNKDYIYAIKKEEINKFNEMKQWLKNDIITIKNIREEYQYSNDGVSISLAIEELKRLEVFVNLLNSTGNIFDANEGGYISWDYYSAYVKQEVENIVFDLENLVNSDTSNNQDGYQNETIIPQTEEENTKSSTHYAYESYRNIKEITNNNMNLKLGIKQILNRGFDEEINRQETFALIQSVLEIVHQEYKAVDTNVSNVDINTYNKYDDNILTQRDIVRLYNLNIVKGENVLGQLEDKSNMRKIDFKLNRPLSRAELVIICNRIYDYIK
ncbi:MAG: hypothetical protein A2Y18_00265 [Clostridiales bacterium GWD2_32_19]|nr:MAG: hypothetical protein A2Y18_00265 [Clostridiales bacterium GWD2_32_19]